MAKEKKDVKFPFRPSVRVRTAFRQEAQLKRAISIMTEALAKVAVDTLDPWEVLRKEHPEVSSSLEIQKLKYSPLSEMIDIVVD